MTGTTLTITNVDASTLRSLELEARRRGVDVATVARDLLREAAPPPPAPASPSGCHDLDPLAGTWTDADAKEFESAVGEFGRVDPELWK